MQFEYGRCEMAVLLRRDGVPGIKPFSLDITPLVCMPFQTLRIPVSAS